MLRDGTKTLEFWSVIILAVLGVLKQTAFPEIPDQAFYTVILWILARAGVKAAVAHQVDANPAPAIKSSEGVLSAIAAPILGVVEAVTGVPVSLATAIPTMAYTLARTALKMFSKKK